MILTPPIVHPVPCFGSIAAYYCPHAPKAGCVCRKPSPYLLWQACVSAEIWPPEVLYIGDQESDREAAERAGMDFVWAKDFFRWET